MNATTRVWLTVGPFALAAGVGALALVLTSGHEENALLTSILGLSVGWSFAVAGLIAQTRRPENHTGILLIVVGLTFFVGALVDANQSLLFTVGHVLGVIFIGALVHLLLAYPSGRLQSGRERAIVVAAYVVALLANAVPMLFDHAPMDDCDECPENAFLVRDSELADDVFSVLFEGLGFLLLAVVVVVLVRRWRAASPAARSLLGPVLLVGGATLVFFALSIAVYPLSADASEVVGVGFFAGFIATPFVFLWGILRSRLARYEVGALLLDSPEAPTLAETQQSLREALKDPTLQLLYRLEDPLGYFDVDGRRVDLSDLSEGRSVTQVGPEESPLAALVHDPALLAEPELLASVGGALRIRLEKDRSVRELRISEYRSRALLDALPDHIFRLTRDGRYLDFRARDAQNRLIPPDRYLGTSIHDALPKDVADRVIAAAERAFETGEVQTVEGEVPTGANTTFYAEARIVPSGHDEFFMIVRDVTERVLHQEQIRRERDLLNAMADSTPSLLCLVDAEARLSPRPLNRAMSELTGYSDKDASRRSFTELFIAPEDAPEVEATIAAVAADEQVREQETHWLTRDGRRVLVAWTCVALPQIDENRWFSIVGTDVTERRRREDEQAALRRVAVAVASERRPEEVFQTVTEEAGRLLEVDRAHMLRFDEAGREAVVVGAWERDNPGAAPSERRFPLQGGPTTEMRETGRTVRFDVDADDVDPEVRERLAQEGVTSVVVAPVIVSSRLWGGATVALTEGSLPPDTETRIAQFASLVATALANAAAREELHASRARIVEAGDAERRRLERNLHDGAQQRLVSLSLSLRLAQAKLASDPEAADEILSSASVELALALEELRELARGIHPAVLTDRGLGPALESLADRSPLPVQLEQVPDGRLPAPVEAAAFYVVSEALANVTKYADASSVSVRIAQENGFAVVEVADDGVGGADPQAGSGLRGLSDRVAALEGRLAIVSPPGAGTRIRAEIPYG